MSTITDSIRTLFRIRAPRQPPPPGLMPKFGAIIACDDVKMIVDTDLTEELWDWLLFMGWREVSAGKERRHYRFAPKDACFALKKATLGQRDLLHRRVMRQASYPTAVNRGQRAAPRLVAAQANAPTRMMD